MKTFHSHAATQREWLVFWLILDHQCFTDICLKICIFEYMYKTVSVCFNILDIILGLFLITWTTITYGYSLWIICGNKCNLCKEKSNQKWNSPLICLYISMTVPLAGSSGCNQDRRKVCQFASHRLDIHQHQFSAFWCDHNKTHSELYLVTCDIYRGQYPWEQVCKSFY